MCKPFLELFQDDGVVVFDGAMGTMLYNKGVFLNHCFDLINLSNPELIMEIHSAYVKAGAQVIETNTFGANRYKLTKHELRDKVSAINFQGAQLARRIASDQILVAGAMGPLGLKIEPWGPTSVEEANEAFREQAEALLRRRR